ncbi:MAG: ABC transporter permease [Deltaproteobacteria bacterium]|nr:ABC transporter permease [Deltaproteobacteria bacterium]
MIPSPRWLAFYAAVAVVVAWLFLRGWRRLRRSLGRALLWWSTGCCGVAFAVLATLSARMVEIRGTYLLRQELVRFAVLGTGVVFVLAILAALLPAALDSLERGRFASFVGARHIRATKSGFLTVISVLSMAGVAVSSCALCSVTSIMGGFGYDLKRKILGNTAHIVIDVAKTGGFAGYEPLLADMRNELVPRGAAATPVVGSEAMASSSTNTAGALVRGIDPATIGQVIDLEKNIEVGRFDYLLRPERLVELPPDEIIGRGPSGEPYFKGPPFDFPDDLDAELTLALRPSKVVHPGIVLGRELAKSLHVMVGDQLTLLSPMGELGPTGIMPRARKFRVAAVFYSGMYEYDAAHAYVLLDVAQRFFSLEGRITNIDIRVPDAEKVDGFRPLCDQIAAGANRRGHEPPLRVRDWKEMNKNLFSALKLERIATFIILSIAIAVASFCIICTLLLMVTEKAKEIAILKALGASDGAVQRVFVLEGVIIGTIGTVFGVCNALALCLGLSWTGVRLDPDVYYIDRLPVNVDPADYAMVTLAALLICTLATLYPAHTAAKLRPVDGLRYE